MGRNHNLYNGVRIGAPLIYADNLIDADNVANGRPIRNVAERFRESSTFLPSVGWTFDDNITDTTPNYDNHQQAVASTNIGDQVKRIQIQRDGQKLWVFGDAGGFAALQSWSLDTPFDLSSASNGWSNGSADLTYSTFRYWRMRSDAQAEFSSADDWLWSEDGMRGYLFSSNQIYQYECSAPYTLVSLGNNEKIIADSKVTGLKNEDGTRSVAPLNGNTFISRDGRYLFYTGIFSGASVTEFINKFELSTPWDITGSLTINQFADQSIDEYQFVGTSWPYTSGSNSYAGITFSPDGTRMFLQQRAGGDFVQFELSTPWDLDTINPNIINTFKPIGSVSDKHTATYDGKYWYTWDNIAGSSNYFSRYSQVKHGGNI
jgi:hypothetical protein